MFTIKHEESSGHESLREAKTIWRDAPEPGTIAPERPLYADVGDTHPLAFQSGSVYVMNAAGKTVATYHFA